VQERHAIGRGTWASIFSGGLKWGADWQRRVSMKLARLHRCDRMPVGMHTVTRYGIKAGSRKLEVPF